MLTSNPVMSLAMLLRAALFAALATFTLGSANAAQLVSSQLSFASQDQSMWSAGEAFQFNYSRFFGVDSNPAPVTFNPAARSGTGYSDHRHQSQ